MAVVCSGVLRRLRVIRIGIDGHSAVIKSRVVWLDTLYGHSLLFRWTHVLDLDRNSAFHSYDAERSVPLCIAASIVSRS